MDAPERMMQVGEPVTPVTMVHDRGRVGARVNLVDALAVVVVIVLIPMAFGSYLLFRTPRAKLLGVSPTQVLQGRNQRVEIEGTNLRPFMRVSFNRMGARTFLLGSTKYALIDLPDLTPGIYDVVLYDYAEEVDRLPKALSVVTNTTDVELEVVGAFKAASFPSLKVGDKLPPTDKVVAEIVSLGQPGPSLLRLHAGDETVPVPVAGQQDIPATLRLKCFTVRSQDGAIQCKVPGPTEPAVVAPDTVIPLLFELTPTGSPKTWINFQIAAVHPLGTPANVTARIRFVASSALIGMIKTGDRDASAKAYAHGATLAGLGAPRPLTPAESPGRLFPGVGPLLMLDASVDVPANPGADGWSYKDQPLKAGAPFTFETAEYVIHGEVVAVSRPAAVPERGPAGK
jgi:hypothetical protein